MCIYSPVIRVINLETKHVLARLSNIIYTVLCRSSVEGQKGLTISHWHTQLEHFGSELTIYVIYDIVSGFCFIRLVYCIMECFTISNGFGMWISMYTVHFCYYDTVLAVKMCPL